MSEHVTDITTPEQLQELMSEGGPAGIIDFWANWCGPCKMMAPHFDAVAKEYADEPVQFYKLDTENYPELAAAFHVRSLPTVMVVHDGQILDVIIGAKDSHALAKKADWVLSKARGEGFFERLFGRKKKA
ncbi:MAG: thioredoxin [Myxococcota bacterium]|nr:thioredoxin [Myxococcota bacterium]